MNRNKSWAFFFLFLFNVDSAHAYLDPGTGSILIQGLIAAIAGGLYTLKIYWHKIKMFLSSSTDENSEEDENTDAVPNKNE